MSANMARPEAVDAKTAAALELLPERTMITCHRDILAGRKQPHDVEVMEI